jgi:hypothetical protein
MLDIPVFHSSEGGSSTFQGIGFKAQLIFSDLTQIPAAGHKARRENQVFNFRIDQKAVAINFCNHNLL